MPDDALEPAPGAGGPPSNAPSKLWSWRQARRRARAEALGRSGGDHALEMVERGRSL